MPSVAFDSEGLEDDLRRPLPPKRRGICLYDVSRNSVTLRFWATLYRPTRVLSAGSTGGRGGWRRLSSSDRWLQ